jgi:hypothetical protein
MMPVWPAVTTSGPPRAAYGARLVGAAHPGTRCTPCRPPPATGRPRACSRCSATRHRPPLGAANALKAHDYLAHGRLRAVSKVAIALEGAGTDTTTLWRVLKEAHAEGNPAGKWDELKATPGLDLVKAFSGDKTLDASLADDLEGHELTKARAILEYGDLRPVDEIVIALSQAGTDEALLFKGLAAANADTIEKEYSEYRFVAGGGGSLLKALDDELSGEDYNRALALLGREQTGGWAPFGETQTTKVEPKMRLVAFVKAAAGGLGTNIELIWEQVGRATQEQKDELAKLLADKNDPLDLRGTFGDLSDADLARLHAMLGVKEEAGAAGGLTADQAADDKVRELRALGGVDRDTIFDKLKLTKGAQWTDFKSRAGRTPPHRSTPTSPRTSPRSRRRTSPRSSTPTCGSASTSASAPSATTRTTSSTCSAPSRPMPTGAASSPTRPSWPSSATSARASATAR